MYLYRSPSVEGCSLVKTHSMTKSENRQTTRTAQYTTFRREQQQDRALRSTLYISEYTVIKHAVSPTAAICFCKPPFRVPPQTREATSQPCQVALLARSRDGAVLMQQLASTAGFVTRTRSPQGVGGASARVSRRAPPRGWRRRRGRCHARARGPRPRGSARAAPRKHGAPESCA